MQQMKNAYKELFEVGDVFLGLRQKLKGLTFYKSRFGGDLYQKFLGEKMLQDTKAKRRSTQTSGEILAAPKIVRQDSSLILIMSYRGNLKELNGGKLSFWEKLEPNEFRQHRISHRDFYANPRNWKYQIKALEEKCGIPHHQRATLFYSIS